MNPLYYTIYSNEITRLLIAATDLGIQFIRFIKNESENVILEKINKKYSVQQSTPFFFDLISQFDLYFNGKPVRFSAQLNLTGTPFQRQVWNLVQKIPWGQTKTYGQIAAELDKSGASRAVGAANGANPIPIIVPCHRVLASNGKLGGYAGGLEVKDALLRLEGAVI
ncbi:methylated-DNA--[protein]-cysteine S-methyltransferase [candidate division KSB1 bacterium]|nr:methylated-DNA--[protein]-cysteine S-methyltransferase [candidate division KSB1 bacterium]